MCINCNAQSSALLLWNYDYLYDKKASKMLPQKLFGDSNEDLILLNLWQCGYAVLSIAHGK